MRNGTQTSIAPTGTISIIAGTSASIEPLFALVYHRSGTLEGASLQELNPLFLRYARQKWFYSENLVQQLSSGQSLREIETVPKPAKQLFEAALEIDAEDHLRMQAAFQGHVDNAVSKTINLPESATAGDVAGRLRNSVATGTERRDRFPLRQQEQAGA
jgi:ribonucleoside-diphosphate reductase alpha chain